ncbi:MAG: dihydrolipoyl dehydrogenase, partial [Xanthomonadaceae bacterium]|nr:dihydrolipoyl dehydrogenase [Xanthomonadaceae bacterium]
MTDRITITVPDIGDFKDVEVIELLVAVGDAIKVDDGLVTIETDKAAMDVPVTHAGKIVELKVKVGDKVSEGTEIAVVEVADHR